MVFDKQKMIDDAVNALISVGMAPELAKQEAAKDVEKMGVTKIYTGNCPRGAKQPFACMLCYYGHMTECHYPHNCQEAECSHYKSSQEF